MTTQADGSAGTRESAGVREAAGACESSAPRRDWSALHAEAAAIALLPERSQRMRAFIALVWSRMQGTGISWVGFYEAHADAPENERLVLAAREPKPACSPIGLHGACGQSLLSGQPILVPDIRELGAAYIACDPRDLSELVIPCRAADGTVWGVLDLDSHEIGSFRNSDTTELVYLLKLAGVG